MKTGTSEKNIISFFKSRPDHFLLILAVLVLAAGITGVLLKKPVKPVPTIVFTQWWHNDLDPGTLENLIAEYEENHENIKIILNSRSYEEVKKLLLEYRRIDPESESDAEEIPVFPGDVLALDPLWIEELYKNMALDSSFSASEPVISYFFPFFYNIEMLKDAGFNRPPRNRSELISYSEAVTKTSDGRYGIGFALGANNSKGIYEDIYPWFWASGVSLTGGGRTFTETFDFFSRLFKENLVHPQSFSWGKKEKREAFINNRLAFMTGPVQDIEFLRREMGEESFSISVIPAADNYLGKPVFGTSDYILGIFKDSLFREEAEEFISFLLEKSPYISEKAHIISAENFSQDNDLLYSKAWELYIAADFVREFSGLEEYQAAENSILLNETERENIFRQELIILSGEDQTPASAAAAVRERWGL